MLRPLAYAAFVTGVGMAAQASAQTRDIGDVFRDFESICFSYAEHGYGIEQSFLIEQAGFKFLNKTSDGSDVYNSDATQLVIGEKACAFGMRGLPFEQMLQWTKTWVMSKGFANGVGAKNPHGQQFWAWSGEGYNVVLEDDKFPDGTPITGLVLTRKHSGP